MLEGCNGFLEVITGKEISLVELVLHPIKGTKLTGWGWSSEYTRTRQRGYQRWSGHM